MRQLLIECSEPGLVVSLTEELEHVLRHVDFARAQALSKQLSALATELGPEFEQAWRDFRLEMPNDGGHPPAFGNRGDPDKEQVRELLGQASERELGSFTLRSTFLLPEGGPAPETREQYIHDLADSIRHAMWEERAFLVRPITLPNSMIAYRQQLMEEHVSSVLDDRAKNPTIGWRWVQDTTKRLTSVLREINTRAEAVFEYEVKRLDPADVEPEEHLRWAVLAVQLGKDVEKWFRAAAEPLPYLYQRAALVDLLWTECRGRAHSFLDEQLESVIDQSEDIYHTDGVEALRQVRDELRQPPWKVLEGLLAEEKRE
ncbi:MAG: hypothetical protein JXA14_23825 [Anaerolineae bacterium]|nr:hypothetical protein [Anaerolineae bacterium]